MSYLVEWKPYLNHSCQGYRYATSGKCTDGYNITKEAEKNYLDPNTNIDEQFLSKIINNVVKSRCFRYEQSCGVNFLTLLFKRFVPTQENLKLFTAGSYYEPQIDYFRIPVLEIILLNAPRNVAVNYFEMVSEALNYLSVRSNTEVNQRNKQKAIERQKKIEEIILLRFLVTPLDIKFLITIHSKKIILEVENKLKTFLLNKHPELDMPTVFTNACKNIDLTFNGCIKLLLSHGCLFTPSEIKLVCENGGPEAIEFVLQQTRFNLSGEYFKLILNPSRYHYIKEKYNYVQKQKTDDIPDKIKVFQKYGYKITYDDIAFAIKHKVQIPHSEKLGIKADDHLVALSYANGFHLPLEHTDKEAERQLKLFQIVSKQSVPELRKFLNDNKDIVPNNECMVRACNFKSNWPNVKMLIDKGGKITHECVQVSTLRASYNFIRKIIEASTNPQTEMNELKKKLEEKETEVKHLKQMNELLLKMNTQREQSESFGKILSKIQTEYTLVSQLKSKEQQLELVNNLNKQTQINKLQLQGLCEEIKQDLTNNLVNSLCEMYEKQDNIPKFVDENLPKFVEDTPQKIIGKISNSETEETPIILDQIEEETSPFIKFDITPEELVTRQNAQTESKFNTVRACVRKIFGVNLNVPYKVLKMQILEYMYNHKWTRDDYIKLPLNVRLMLDITQGKYIKFDDVDYFIISLYEK